MKEDGSASYTDEIGISWYTHPAFTFGSDELSGIWVGKFETTGTATTPTILPNQESLRSQNVKAQFNTSRKFNAKLNNGDSHMMKNSEWGAVAYLSQSKYGKYGNEDYVGEEKEVYINNCNSFITGIAGDTVSALPSELTCANVNNKYDGEQGIKASTTGNIYGVYDMNGGAWEYVMANYNNVVGSSGFEEEFFTDSNNSKYYNKYSSSDTIVACTDDECKGHAMNETQGWYEDFARFDTSSTAWVLRGGFWNETPRTGIFFFNSYHGSCNRDYNGSFCVVFS